MSNSAGSSHQRTERHDAGSVVSSRRSTTTAGTASTHAAPVIGASGTSAGASGAGSGAPEPMGAFERLQHARNAATRIGHALEHHRHFQRLYSTAQQNGSDSDAGPASARRLEGEVNNFFAELDSSLPQLLVSGTGKAAPAAASKAGAATNSNGKDQKRAAATAATTTTTAAKRPTTIAARAVLVAGLHRTAVALADRYARLSVPNDQSGNGNGISTEEALDQPAAGSDLTYPTLQRQLLQTVLHQLVDLTLLLPDPRTGRAAEIPTRQRLCSQGLQDAVRHYIDEVDALHSTRLRDFISEAFLEGVRYSATLNLDESVAAVAASAKKQAKQTKQHPDQLLPPPTRPLYLVSAFLVEVGVGLVPGRSARVVLDHLHQLAAVCNDRVGSELALVKRLLQARSGSVAAAAAADVAAGGLGAAPGACALGEDAQSSLLQQQEQLGAMMLAVHEAQSAHGVLSSRWDAAEKDILNRARSSSAQADHKTLVGLKNSIEVQIIEEGQAAGRAMQRACMPFLCPSFCRRRQETYDSPCQIRIGLRFWDERNRVFIPITNVLAVKTDPSQPDLDEYLLPSAGQLWFPFGSLPEVVKGARCVLRENVAGGGGGGVAGKITTTDAAGSMHERCLEEAREVGGYFIIRGGERILRQLLLQRANVPLNIERGTFSEMNPGFSNKAVLIRCKRGCGLAAQNYFFYKTTGDIVFSFARRLVWHVPVTLLLFAMRPVSALAVYNMLCASKENDEDARSRAEALLQHHAAKPYGNLTHWKEFLAVLGRMYRQYQQNALAFQFIPELGPGRTDMSCHQDAWYGLFMLRRHVLPHLNGGGTTPDLPSFARGGADQSEWTEEDLAAEAAALAAWPGRDIESELNQKFDALIDIIRQLHGFVGGSLDAQGNDIPCYQETMTAGQIMISAFETSVNKYMKFFVYRLASSMRPDFFQQLLAEPQSPSVLSRLRGYIDHAAPKGSDALSTFTKLLTTGNFSAENEDDYVTPQDVGWIVMADHLNFFRFFELLRVLHRGKRIADMRSSEVRRFACESFGFICMVHSPDGADCGVVNHMTTTTVVTGSLNSKEAKRLKGFIRTQLPGFVPAEAPTSDREGCLPVFLEGRIIGYVAEHLASNAAQLLRSLKVIDLTQLEALYPEMSPDERLSMRNGMIPRSALSGLQLIEVVFVPPRTDGSSATTAPQRGTTPGAAAHAKPCIMIFTEHGRLMRPIRELRSGSVVFVGTWEHVYLDIATVPSDLEDARRVLGRTFSHMELNGSAIISLTSTTIPFFEYNCSPRNLFQCGLSKQTAGTQLQSMSWRREAKLFRLYTAQRYLVRTLPMDNYALDEFSLGVNAVVAILSYTGYDMDDAIIINRTSAERGMLQAMVTVSKIVDLAERNAPAPKNANGAAAATAAESELSVTVFYNLVGLGAETTRFNAELFDNGLPPLRVPTATWERDHSRPSLSDNTPIYCTAKRVTKTDHVTGRTYYEYSRHHVTRWKHMDKGEEGWVHHIVPLTYDGPDVTSALFVFRIPRWPHIGDKFSSRHGQKGTLPLHIKALDLPFSGTSGIIPDVIINPHAFPSRMTVGMVLEIMAGKVAAVQGRFYDQSPWAIVDEDARAAKDIGDILASSGYHRHGREQLICGVSGEIMEADIFMGISGYQRLRHMVLDKWQSRARTDASHRAVTKTGQPVKGRKRHGGVRVGEMERDSLVAHGSAEVVVDRLLHVSDETKAFICVQCGGLMSIFERHSSQFSTWKMCRYCGAGSDQQQTAGIEGATDSIQLVDIPQVLRLWIAELTSVGVRVTMKIA